MSRILRALTGIVVVVNSLLLPGLVLPPAASAVTPFVAVADSYVDANNPTKNFGTRTYVKADASPTQVSYLKFTVSGFDSVGYAVLHVHADSNHRTGVTVRAVTDTGWGEASITYQNAPAPGASLGATGPTTSGTWMTVDVSDVVTGNGTYAFALTTTSGTSVKFSSREGANAPQLVVDTVPPPVASSFTVSPVSGGYRAVAPETGQTFTGTLKFVGESAVAVLEKNGGGLVQFTAGDFDFGPQYFKFEYALHNITFQGAGIDQTVIRNWTDVAADTEPFNFRGTYGVTVRDLTVSAGGPTRLTSDALDFDNGNDSVVEDVKITDSRARGIVFDGKNDDWSSARNVVRRVIITGADSHGIQFLASTDNLVEYCQIYGAAGHGIQVVKSSTVADQPNKKASRNILRYNVIDQAGQDGIDILSSDDTQVIGNSVTNSSDDVSGRDGIRVTVADGVTAERTLVSGNTATDNQATKTQKYGLNLASSSVIGTVVSGNDFAGNLIAPIRDLGSGTVYQ